jgi:hypothetical protein
MKIAEQPRPKTPAELEKHLLGVLEQASTSKIALVGSFDTAIKDVKTMLQENEVVVGEVLNDMREIQAPDMSRDATAFVTALEVAEGAKERGEHPNDDELELGH